MNVRRAGLLTGEIGAAAMVTAGAATLVTAGAAALVAAGTTSVASAHPHENVDQQVHLAIGSDRVVAQVRIAPSYTDGAAIFARIDIDGDGVVSEAEATRFGVDVITDAALSLNGTAVRLRMGAVSVPTRDMAAAGFGVIEIEAVAAIRVADDSTQEIGFEIAYAEIAHDWFIQPFYFAELMTARAVPAIERVPSGDRITVRIPERHGETIPNPG